MKVIHKYMLSNDILFPYSLCGRNALFKQLTNEPNEVTCKICIKKM
jgi:hypothetical protein